MSAGIAALIASSGDPLITLANELAADSTVAPATATAIYNLLNTGVISASSGIGLTRWITPQINMGNYEVFATLNSGTLTSGTTGSWLALSTSRSWTRNAISATQLAQIGLQIRKIGTTTVLATATINFQAESI